MKSACFILAVYGAVDICYVGGASRSKGNKKIRFVPRCQVSVNVTELNQVLDLVLGLGMDTSSENQSRNGSGLGFHLCRDHPYLYRVYLVENFNTSIALIFKNTVLSSKYYKSIVTILVFLTID